MMADIIKKSINATGIPQVDNVIKEIVDMSDTKDPDEGLERLIEGKNDINLLMHIKTALATNKNLDTRVAKCYGMLVPEFAEMTATIEQMEERKELEVRLEESQKQRGVLEMELDKRVSNLLHSARSWAA